MKKTSTRLSKELSVTLSKIPNMLQNRSLQKENAGKPLKKIGKTLGLSNEIMYNIGLYSTTKKVKPMLSPTRRSKFLAALKLYSKKYLQGNIVDLDESGTRLMINTFLTDVLGFTPIDEIKTEYMIKGTYADYVIQTKGIRHFLVEVKSLSLNLSDKHLRQAINYGANEGIEWAMLANGRQFELYKILFNKPIESRKVFSFNLTDQSKLNDIADIFQHLQKDAINSKGLELLWNKHCALEAPHLAGLLFAPAVSNFIKKAIKEKFNCKFSDEEIADGLKNLIKNPMNLESIIHMKVKKEKKKTIPSVTGGQKTLVENTTPQLN